MLPWPSSAGTPRARSCSAAGPWPISVRASGCWNPSPAGTWPGPSCCAAGWPRPGTRCRRLSVAGGRAERRPMSRGDAITWARCSEPRAGWTPQKKPTSRHSRSTGRMAGRFRQPLASGMWAWPRWPTSGTSSTLPYGTSPRASRCAASSSSPRRWPLAWRCWRGSGRPRARRPAPSRRSARPGWPRRARTCRACSTPSRRSGPGCCWPRVTSPGPPAGRENAASASATSRTTHGSPSISCWRGCCSPRTVPVPRRAAGAPARGGHRPGPHRQRHRDPGAAGAGPGAPRR